MSLPRRRTLCTCVGAAVMLLGFGALSATAAPAVSAPPVTTPAQLAAFLPVANATATLDAAGAYHLTWSQASWVRGVDVYASTDPEHIRTAGSRVATGINRTATVTGLEA